MKLIGSSGLRSSETTSRVLLSTSERMGGSFTSERSAADASMRMRHSARRISSRSPR
jgi:hypothetical protein